MRMLHSSVHSMSMQFYPLFLQLAKLQEFQQKRSRGGGSGRKRKMPWFYTINNASVETCLDADRYQALQ